MGNVATKERSRSNSVSSALHPQPLYQRRGSDHAGSSSSRRSRTNSVPAIGSGSDRHQLSGRKGKGKNKSKEETSFHLRLDPTETVDGGYLQPQGVYPGPYDFDYKIIRQFIIDRKLAPFYKGLSDFDSNWTDRQLLAAVHGVPPLPPSDTPANTTEDAESPAIPEPSVQPANDKLEITVDEQADSIIIPEGKPATSSVDTSALVYESGALVDSRIEELTSVSSSPIEISISHDECSPNRSNSPSIPFPSIERAASRRPSDSTDPKNSTVDVSLSTTSLEVASIARERAHTTSRIVTGPVPDRISQELILYKDAIECPICFMFYPKLLNLTRCCAQPICTECFVAIKRLPPHPPHDAEPAAAPSAPSQPNHIADNINLVSEPAACPYCMTPDMGVTFSPPPYRTGIEAGKRNNSLSSFALFSSPHSSSVNVHHSSAGSTPVSLVDPATKRRGSLPASSPDVVTTDQIRPDWRLKLVTARAHAARKSAAATAIHISAFLTEEAGSPSRSRERSSRQSRLSANPASTGGASPSPRPGSRQPSIPYYSGMHMFSHHLAGRSVSESEGARRSAPRSMVVDPVSGTLVNSRLQELEEMMILEAIRLSILEEEKQQVKKGQTPDQGEGNQSTTTNSAPTQASNQEPVTVARDATGNGN